VEGSIADRALVGDICALSSNPRDLTCSVFFGPAELETMALPHPRGSEEDITIY